MYNSGTHQCGARGGSLLFLLSIQGPPHPNLHYTRDRAKSVPPRKPSPEAPSASCACPMTSPPHPRLSGASCSLDVPRSWPLLEGQAGPSPRQAPLAGPPMPAPSGASTPIRRPTQLRPCQAQDFNDSLQDAVDRTSSSRPPRRTLAVLQPSVQRSPVAHTT